MTEQQGKDDEVLNILTNAPQEILFEGVKYNVYALDLSSMTALRGWAKKRIVKETRENVKLMGDDLPSEMLTKIWESTYGQLRDPMISDAMECPEAIIFWLYLSIKSGNDDITEDIVDRYARSKNIQEILALLVKLNGMDEGQAGNGSMAQTLKERRKQIGLESS